MYQAARSRAEGAFRPGTKANQWSHVLLYVAFSHFFQEQDFPATAKHLLRFAEFLLRSYRSHKSATNALASLCTFHLRVGMEVQAFDHFSVKLWKRALPATVRHVPRPAPAMPVAVLDRLCRIALEPGGTGVVFAALLAMAFASLARLSSMVPESSGAYDSTRLPVGADLTVEGEVAWLRLKWGKCQQDTGDGYWVPMVAVHGAPSCPVRHAKALLSLKRGRRGEEGPLFTLHQGDTRLQSFSPCNLLFTPSGGELARRRLREERYSQNCNNW